MYSVIPINLLSDNEAVAVCTIDKIVSVCSISVHLLFHMIDIFVFACGLIHMFTAYLQVHISVLVKVNEITFLLTILFYCYNNMIFLIVK